MSGTFEAWYETQADVMLKLSFPRPLDYHVRTVGISYKNSSSLKFLITSSIGYSSVWNLSMISAYHFSDRY